MIMGKKDMGLKIGLEIHQQLDTGKLFCRCPSIIRTDKPDIRIKRKLNPVAGETGKIDIAAAYEAEKKKTFVYEGYSDTNCLIEYDESPPLEIDEEALKIALQISLLLNAEPVNVSQVMRKTVINGSNTSGFQRTILIAKNGFVKVDGEKITIPTIFLEEDAAKEVSQSKDETVFRLDRLGIPLVEISTAPEIKNKEQAKQVALKIGDILRACKVKRGIGTIRQDVNLSIRNGARTEIKGVQEPSLIPKTIEKEIERQQELLKKKKKIEATVRDALENGETRYMRPLPGAARMYPETDIQLVKISDKMIEEIKNNLPALREDIISDLKKLGLSEEYAGIITKENKFQEFMNLINIKVDKNIIAKALILWPKEIASRENIANEIVSQKLSFDEIKRILEQVEKGKISESSIKSVMTSIAKEEKTDIKKASSGDIEKEVKKIIEENKGATFNALMGIAMSKLKGKADGKEIAGILKKHVKQGKF